VRGVFGPQGGRAVPSVRTHVRLRELRVPDEEVRAVPGPDTTYGAILGVLRWRGCRHLREGMQRLRYVAPRPSSASVPNSRSWTDRCDLNCLRVESRSLFCIRMINNDL